MRFPLCWSVVLFVSLYMSVHSLLITCDPDNVDLCLDQNGVCYDCTFGSSKPRFTRRSSLLTLDVIRIKSRGQPRTWEATDCCALVPKSGDIFEYSERESRRLCGRVFRFFRNTSSVRCRRSSEGSPPGGRACEPPRINRQGRREPSTNCPRP